MLKRMQGEEEEEEMVWKDLSMEKYGKEGPGKWEKQR